MTYNEISALKSDQLAEQILNKIWANYELGSDESLLLEVAIDRLKDIDSDLEARDHEIKELMAELRYQDYDY